MFFTINFIIASFFYLQNKCVSYSVAIECTTVGNEPLLAFRSSAHSMAFNKQ